MRVLVACEYSGRVREAFAALGHDAWSCDLLPTDYPSPKHVQGDCLSAIATVKPDLLIAHPPCTYLTSAAEWAYNDPDFSKYPGVGYHQKVTLGTLTGRKRRDAREQAISFFQRILDAPVQFIAVENPVGCISRRLRESDQRIQPYQFGDDAKKTTCLWLKGLPLLVPTKLISPRFVGGKPRWGNQTGSGQNRLGPSGSRGHERSLTCWGVAWAMAEQWGQKKL